MDSVLQFNSPGLETPGFEPPSRWLMLAEARAVYEAGAALALWPLLQMTPRGDGHAVLVLPGLGAGDRSTELMRRFLRSRGYDAQGWGLGQNLGPRAGVEARMLRKLKSLHAARGKVSLVGWSLGGVYARMMASLQPDMVRGVVTLGTPFTGSPRATRAWHIYEKVSGQPAEDSARRQLVTPTPPVPTTSIFSRTDGVVSWRCSVEQPGAAAENIEVLASHLGLGAHPAVFYALADRLAQPQDAWRPFDRSRIGAWVFPDPARAQ
ncbi:triacylglycerol lipase [Variovorax sp. dw_308]|uniref:esterase/lipase family protein n=1 Tax=Variovorax sp. dw_308 TaxID=2721546 RepID=UPI001C45A3F2|nr:alpha/beta hydrolase [Variovorax sp. dw_308]